MPSNSLIHASSRGLTLIATALMVACGPSRAFDSDAAMTGSDVARTVDSSTQTDAAMTGSDVPGTMSDVPATTSDVPTMGSIVLVTNTSDCSSANSISPDETEIDEWMAIRLTPPSTPFVVTTIRFQMISNEDGCDSTLGTEVQVYTGAGPTPPATPTVGATVTIPAGSATAIRHVSATLPTPVHVAAGQDVFVAVKMVAMTMCVGTCEDNPGIASRNWWSNAVAAPYPWSMLTAFGLDDNAIVEAEGYAE